MTSNKCPRIPIIPVILLALAAGALSSCSQKEAQGGAAATSLLERDDTVKSAYLSVISEDQNAFRDEIYSNLERFEATVESESWSNEDSLSVSGSISVKLPSSRFLPYVEYLRSAYKIESTYLYARTTDGESVKRGEVSGDGTVYSYVRISVEREIGFYESFLLGTEHASEALKTSLESIVPVLLFLLPYACIVGLILVAVRLVKRAFRLRTGGKRV